MNGTDHLAKAKRCLARVEEITDEELVSAIVLEEMATSQALIAIAEEMRAARGVLLHGGQEFLALDAISHAEWGQGCKLYVDCPGYPPSSPMILIGEDARAVAEALGMEMYEEAGDAKSS